MMMFRRLACYLLTISRARAIVPFVFCTNKALLRKDLDELRQARQADARDLAAMVCPPPLPHYLLSPPLFLVRPDRVSPHEV